MTKQPEFSTCISGLFSEKQLRGRYRRRHGRCNLAIQLYNILSIIRCLPFGGPDGELGASLRYLSQRYSMPYPEQMGLLTDIGVEEYRPKEYQ